MAAASSRPVTLDEEKPGSSGSSQESSTSARFTPEAGSDEDDLEDLEEGEGYELRPLDEGGRSSRKQRGDGYSAAGADNEAADQDEDGSQGDFRAKSRRRQRSASVQSYELYTPDEERRVRRKLDTHLVLFVALLYL